MEDYLALYYQVLDKFRNNFLQDEYRMCDKMEKLESNLKILLNSTQTLSVMEVFNEQYRIKDEIQELK